MEPGSAAAFTPKIQVFHYVDECFPAFEYDSDELHSYPGLCEPEVKNLTDLCSVSLKDNDFRFAIQFRFG